jgi:ATP-dependent Zn protease
MQSPTEDLNFESRARLLARIRVAVAGRVAEEIVFGWSAVTSGAASDVEVATRIARNMVARYAMGAPGFVLIDPEDPLLFDPKGSALEDIRSLVATEMTAVRSFLTTHCDALKDVAAALQSHETLDGERLYEILGPLARSWSISEPEVDRS